METSAQTYPGVEFAYEFVRPSYEFLAQRREVIDNRIRAWTTLAVTLMFGAPILVKSALTGGPLITEVFIAAVFPLAAILVLAPLSQGGGTIIGLDPGAMYRTMLHLDEWEFKQTAIYRAAEAFEHNLQRNNWKATIADWIVRLVCYEAALLFLWAIQMLG
jgi:hypothetical protein